MLQGIFDAKTAKVEYVDLFKSMIKREGADKLLDFMENKCDFFTAPASSRFHNSCEGGLCQHSLNVYYCLKEYFKNPFISETLGQTYSDETLAVVALLHDFCKVDNYTVDYKNVKNESGAWERVPYYKADDKLPYGHGEKSVYMLNGFISLTREEAMAIRWHMGFADTDNKNLVSQAFEMFPLAFALSTADMQATYYVEGK